MDINFNFSIIGILHQIFQLLESIGMGHEFVVLALIGVGVGIVLQKQYKLNNVHRKEMLTLFTEVSKTMSKFSDGLEDVKKHHEKCFQCATERNTKQEVTRETTRERLDSIEDGIKEIKKTLLFK